jgi:hypothetical protein
LAPLPPSACVLLTSVLLALLEAERAKAIYAIKTFQQKKQF